MAQYDIDWSAVWYGGSPGVTVGYVVCPNTTNTGYLHATTANRTAVGRMSGIAITNSDSNDIFAIQYSGEVPSSITGLGVGITAAVRASSTGAMERVIGPVLTTDYVVGDCDALGSVTLSPFSRVNSQLVAASPTGPAGGVLGGTYPNPTISLTANASLSGVLPDANQAAQTMGGQVTGTTAASVVVQVNGATVPVAGSLTIGNALKVTGASSLGYSAINLAGGTNHVGGVLPAANQANQAMAGDVTGTTAASVVSAITGASPFPITPAALQWLAATVAPSLKQADKTTNAGTGAAMVVRAQNETGTTSTGGSLTLGGGTGTSAYGETIVGSPINGGLFSKDMANTAYAATAAESAANLYIVTGIAFTADRVLTLARPPTAGAMFVIRNNAAAGAFGVTVKFATGTATAAILPATSAVVIGDGVNAAILMLGT